MALVSAPDGDLQRLCSLKEQPSVQCTLPTPAGATAGVQGLSSPGAPHGHQEEARHQVNKQNIII